MNELLLLFIGILILTLAIVDLIIRAKINEHAEYMKNNYKRHI